MQYKRVTEMHVQTECYNQSFRQCSVRIHSYSQITKQNQTFQHICSTWVQKLHTAGHHMQINEITEFQLLGGAHWHFGNMHRID